MATGACGKGRRLSRLDLDISISSRKPFWSKSSSADVASFNPSKVDVSISGTLISLLSDAKPLKSTLAFGNWLFPASRAYLVLENHQPIRQSWFCSRATNTAAIEDTAAVVAVASIEEDASLPLRC